jgi:hypothetical protein
MLEDDEWKAKSDREIARLCNVHHVTVINVRKSISGEIHQIESRQVARKGKTYTMSTAKIGKKEEVKAEPEAAPYYQKRGESILCNAQDRTELSSTLCKIEQSYLVTVTR